MTTNIESFIKEPIRSLIGNFSRIFHANFYKNFAQLNIEPSLYSLLLIETVDGRHTQPELVQKLSCYKILFILIIDYLSSRGFVIRIKDTSDRRKYNLDITENVKKALPDINKAINVKTSVAIEHIQEKEVNKLFFILRKNETNLSSIINNY